VKDARFPLHVIPRSRFCWQHHNQSRNSSQLAALQDPSTGGTKGGSCVFRGHGCSGTNFTFRPLPRAARESLDDIEMYYEYDESISIHTAGTLAFEDVSGKQACAVCRYVIKKGAQGIKPNDDAALLSDVVDRFLVDVVLSALDGGGQPVRKRGHESVMQVAQELKSRVFRHFLMFHSLAFSQYPLCLMPDMHCSLMAGHPLDPLVQRL